MASSIFMTLFLSSFILLPSSLDAAATWSSNTLEEVCNINAEDWNQTFCIETLKSDNRIVSATNFDSLATGIIESGLSNATNTRAFMQDMLQHDNVAPLYKQALSECVGQYNEAVNSFQSALAEVKEDKDYMTASYDVRIAADSVSYCQKTLVSLKVDAPSVSAGNKFVRYFAFAADEVVNRIPEKYPPKPKN